MFKRKAISFNLNCPNQRELYEHCANHPNFSGYVKSVLFHHLRSQNNSLTVLEGPKVKVEDVNHSSDIDFVADLL